MENSAGTFTLRNMKKLILLLLSLSLLSGNLVAAESAANRREKFVYAGYAPVGLHVASYLAKPRQIGFFTENTLFGLESGLGRSSYSDADVDATMTYGSQGAWVRYFVGNSLNLLFSYGTRTITLNGQITKILSKEVDGQTLSTPATADTTIVATSKVSTVGFGNLWVTDFGMVIGMDWYVWSRLESSRTTSEIDIITEVDISTLGVEYDKTPIYDQIDESAGILHKANSFPGIFILTVGWAF